MRRGILEAESGRMNWLYQLRGWRELEEQREVHEMRLVRDLLPTLWVKTTSGERKEWDLG